MNGFMHSFIAEMMAICRGHVVALGGNALVAFRLTECVLEGSRHKNQVSAIHCSFRVTNCQLTGCKPTLADE